MTHLRDASATARERQLLNDAPAALMLTNVHGEILAMNARAREWLGGSPAATLERNGRVNLVDWLTPASRLLYETTLMPRLRESGTLNEVILEFRGSDHTRHPYLCNARLLHGDQGLTVHLAMIRAADRIAFERRLLEAQRSAEIASARLALLQEATGQLAIAQGVHDLGQTLVDAAARATQAAWTTVVFTDDDGVPQQWGEAPSAALQHVTREAGTDARVYRNLEELMIGMPQEAPALAEAGVEAVLIVPMVRPGDTTALGAIHCWFRRSRTLEAEVLETMSALATQAERVLEHVRLQERLRHRALHDGLTGLPNRVQFIERLEQQIMGAQRGQRPCSVLFVDLDGFKGINDTFGHAAGDEVLRIVTSRLLVNCRSNELVARLGGDEFVVAAEAEPEGARELAERLRAAIEEPLDGMAAGAPLSSSVGVVTWVPAPGHRRPLASELLSAADEAMYDAKRGGKNAVVLTHWVVPAVPAAGV